MRSPGDIWLCPKCSADCCSNCKLCDGYGFITELEMAAFEGRKPDSGSKDPQFVSSNVLTLDLSEFEQE